MAKSGEKKRFQPAAKAPHAQTASQAQRKSPLCNQLTERSSQLKA